MRESEEILVKTIKWPSTSTATTNDTYCRWLNGPATVIDNNGKMRISHGAIIDLDTYANAIDLTHGLLQKDKFELENHCKELTRIAKTYSLNLTGEGKIRVELINCAFKGVGLTIKDEVISLKNDVSQKISLSNTQEIIGARIAARITALTDDVSLGDLTWFTTSNFLFQPSLADRKYWVLQSFVFPDAERSDRALIYAKWPDSNGFLADKIGFRIAAKTRIDLITFFNAFSHKKWFSYTNITNVTLQIAGTGKIRYKINSVDKEGYASSIVDGILTLDTIPNFIDLGHPSQIEGEIIGIEIEAFDENAFLSKCAWVTTTPPLREVNLGAVITTYRREAAARGAIQRFTNEIIPNINFGSLELFIIDNGNTLDLPDTEKIHLIFNKNLGGAGGFTRGLLELKHSNKFTHALFMDDDASCEPESIWRTMAFISRTNDPRQSMSGAMLLTDRPWFQYEKGAEFVREGKSSNMWNLPLGARDLRQRDVVASNEIDDGINYGGWWYFAFPIDAIKYLPFPFFVRGDDTDFSLSNKLPVVTLNGVAAWCDTFGSKLNPATEYLAWRSWLALQLMHGDRKRNRRCLLLAVRHSIKSGWRFDYASMNASLDGIETVMKGPAAFGESPAPFAQLERAKIRSRNHEIKLINLRNMQLIQHTHKSFRRIASIVTLGGHLLPEWLLQQHTRYAETAWDVGLTSVLRAKTIVTGQEGYLEIHIRNRLLFSKTLLRASWLLIISLLKIQKMGKEYVNNSNSYRSINYWRKTLETTSTKNLKKQENNQ